ncbi:MAG: hypothetical protein PHP36_00085 [Atribacterota bacterium]|nr:hypothetical protein [Atribacterota bacterium]MDD5496821.1 hypothetical protein [Atribacterota bacterium]
MFFISRSRDLYLSIVILLLGGILSLFLYLKIKNLLNSKQAKKRAVISKRAEQKAEKWLKRNGFKIIERQQSRPLIIKAGTTRHRYQIRIDFLVKKNGQTYVVEVKSGSQNSHITNRETRRQLLEYFLAYQPYGIILFDMETKKFSEIKFLLPYFHSRLIENIIFFLLGALIALLGMYLVR